MALAWPRPHMLLYFVFFQKFVAKNMVMKKLGSWGENGNGAGVAVAPIPSLLSRVLTLLITNQTVKAMGKGGTDQELVSEISQNLQSSVFTK